MSYISYLAVVALAVACAGMWWSTIILWRTLDANDSRFNVVGTLAFVSLFVTVVSVRLSALFITHR